MRSSSLDLKRPQSTGSGSQASYVRQYRIPKKLEDKFQATIDNWLAMKIIAKAPVGANWNSPLIAVPKKDALGNHTDFRICFDPRHINKLLKDDKHPIPLLESLLENISGSKIFSAIDLATARLPFRKDWQGIRGIFSSKSEE